MTYQSSRLRLQERSGGTIGRAGFTLLEILLYMAIATTVMAAVIALIAVTLQVRAKYRVLTSLGSQADTVQAFVSQTIRQATALSNLPAAGTVDALGLYLPSDTTTPVLIDSQNGQLRYTDDLGVVTALTASDVTVSNLSFTNLPQPGAPDLVRYQFTLNAVNPSGRAETAGTVTVAGTASSGF